MFPAWEIIAQMIQKCNQSGLIKTKIMPRDNYISYSWYYPMQFV